MLIIIYNVILNHVMLAGREVRVRWTVYDWSWEKYDVLNVGHAHRLTTAQWLNDFSSYSHQRGYTICP